MNTSCMEAMANQERMKKKKGCGKRIRIGYNKVLDCPINATCGITEEYGKIFLCEECKKKLGINE